MKDRFEEQLRESLRRVDAPAGFAERVLAKTAGQARVSRPEGRRNRGSHRPRRTWGWGAWGWQGWAAVAALAVLVVVAGWQWEAARRERALEEARTQARQEALYALRLTNEKMAPARQALARLGLSFGDTGETAEGAAERR